MYVASATIRRLLKCAAIGLAFTTAQVAPLNAQRTGDSFPAAVRDNRPVSQRDSVGGGTVFTSVPLPRTPRAALSERSGALWRAEPETVASHRGRNALIGVVVGGIVVGGVVRQRCVKSECFAWYGAVPLVAVGAGVGALLGLLLTPVSPHE